MISVLILAKNEEKNLPACLESLKWCDDVVVFDSLSSDRTVSIARDGGARVFERAFDNYAAQREAARTGVGYRHPWVLALDADERPEPDLVSEMQAAVARTEHAAFRLRRRDYFFGRWVRHATLYPSWFVRLYQPGRIHYEPRLVHEYPTVSGSVGELKGHLVHQSFNKGLGDWLEKHNRYSEGEAAEALRAAAGTGLDWRGVFSTEPVRRRRALKSLSYRLPARPLCRFLYMYLLRRGFLDGWPGFTYCRLLAIYEYLIVLKMCEMKRRELELAI
jgi:glycosyltransferase involved in cell wall biosynthesis